MGLPHRPEPWHFGPAYSQGCHPVVAYGGRGRRDGLGEPTAGLGCARGGAGAPGPTSCGDRPSRVRRNDLPDHRRDPWHSGRNRDVAPARGEGQAASTPELSPNPPIHDGALAPRHTITPHEILGFHGDPGISRPDFCGPQLRALRVRAFRSSAPDHDLAHLARKYRHFRGGTTTPQGTWGLDTSSFAADRWIRARVRARTRRAQGVLSSSSVCLPTKC